MTKTEVIEYETVERTEQRYQCDHCEIIVPEDDIITIGYVEGEPRSTARFSDTTVDQMHLCDDCINLREALEVREQKDYLRQRWEGFASGINIISHWAIPVLSAAIGTGIILLAGVVSEESKDPGLILSDLVVGGSIFGLVLIVCLSCMWILMGE